MKLPYAVSLGPGSSRADLTGTWRTERPVYQTLTAPCGNACPAGEDVRTWLYQAESGGAGYEAAWRTIMDVNPFPAITGRVCYHPCETACNRGQPRRGGRHQLGRAVPRRPGPRAGLDRRRSTAAADRAAGAGHRRRPGRAVRGLPPGAARPRGHDP